MRGAFSIVSSSIRTIIRKNIVQFPSSLSFLESWKFNFPQLMPPNYYNENNLCLDGIPLNSLQQETKQSEDVFDMTLLFAVPKKRVSSFLGKSPLIC